MVKLHLQFVFCRLNLLIDRGFNKKKRERERGYNVNQYPFYINQLLRDVTPKRRSRRQLAKLDQFKPYVIACFRQLPSSFTVGTDHRHSVCENKPLEPGHEYVFFLLAELNSTAGVS